MYISKHTFDFVFGTCLCLIFHELFRSCAEEPGRAGWWLSAVELLVCVRVPVQLSEPSEHGVLCFAAGAFSWEKPHTQHWRCLRVPYLAPNRSMLGGLPGTWVHCGTL